MNEEEKQALDAIRATFDDLDRWRARSRDAEVPQQGSELAADARVSPYLPPAELARQSLVAATQHLNLARTAIVAKDIYPASHYTVLRGALVGGSMAVWILAPAAAHDRQQRAMRVAYEWHSRAGQYVQDACAMMDPSSEPARHMRETAQHIQTRKAEIRSAWAAGAELAAAQKLEVTEVIRVSSGAVLDTQEAARTQLLWRLMSGDAHALGWPIMVRATEIQPVGGGLGEFRAGGDVVALSDAFLKCHRITKAGWSLFDRRCEGP